MIKKRGSHLKNRRLYCNMTLFLVGSTIKKENSRNYKFGL